MIQQLKNLIMGKQASSASVMRNMLILATGSGVGKLIGIIAIPILTRLYSPGDFGILSVFVSISSILALFGTLRYSVALPLPKQTATAVNLATLNFIILITYTSLVFLILGFFSNVILSKLSYEAILPYWWLLPITILLSGTYEILSQWAIREKDFASITRTKVTQSISGAITKISLGLLAFKPIGLILGNIISDSGGIYVLSRNYFKALKLNIEKITLKRILFLLRHYKDLPKYRLPSQFLLVFAIQSPLLFSTSLFGIEVTGQLGLALSALALPMTVVGASMGQAYYGEIAKLGRNKTDDIYKLTIDTLKKLSLLSLLPITILFFFGPRLFEMAFGNQWIQAGKFSSILCIYLFFQFISSPMVNVFNVLNKQHLFLIINIIRIIIVIAVFSFSYISNLTVNPTIWLYSLSMCFCYIFTIILILTILKNHNKSA